MRRFRVKNWESFQHYKDRNPPWIKLYNSLLEDVEFSYLSDRQQLALIKIWLLASRVQNALPFDEQFISQRIGTKVDLQDLVEKGFITPASNMLAKCSIKNDGLYSETETETETETEQRQTAVSLREEFKEDFALWASTLPPASASRVKPTEDRFKKYKARRQDCSREEIRDALQGWRYDDWLKRPKHNQFEVLIRNRSQVEKFAGFFARYKPETLAESRDRQLERFVHMAAVDAERRGYDTSEIKRSKSVEGLLGTYKQITGVDFFSAEGVIQT